MMWEYKYLWYNPPYREVWCFEGYNKKCCSVIAGMYDASFDRDGFPGRTVGAGSSGYLELQVSWRWFIKGQLVLDWRESGRDSGMLLFWCTGQPVSEHGYAGWIHGWFLRGMDAGRSPADPDNPPWGDRKAVWHGILKWRRPVQWMVGLPSGDPSGQWLEGYGGIYGCRGSGSGILWPQYAYNGWGGQLFHVHLVL